MNNIKLTDFFKNNTVLQNTKFKIGDIVFFIEENEKTGENAIFKLPIVAITKKNNTIYYGFTSPKILFPELCKKVGEDTIFPISEYKIHANINNMEKFCNATQQKHGDPSIKSSIFSSEEQVIKIHHWSISSLDPLFIP